MTQDHQSATWRVGAWRFSALKGIIGLGIGLIWLATPARAQWESTWHDELMRSRYERGIAAIENTRTITAGLDRQREKWRQEQRLEKEPLHRQTGVP